MCDPYYRREQEERLSSIAFDRSIKCISSVDSELRSDLQNIYLKCYQKLRQLEQTRSSTIPKEDFTNFIHQLMYIVDNVNYDYGLFINNIGGSNF